ncbi:MAG TPA: hypothetical protein VHL58_13750 [Thermoanaerobaculia bacterium]|nr:hypothetical protein [Thermoanaerobaculia bacterium]
MNRNKQLQMRLAVIVASATLVGTSAFAESRHRNETHSRSEGRSTVHRERGESRGESTRGHSSQNDSAPRHSAVERPGISPGERGEAGIRERNRDISAPDRDRVEGRTSDRNRGDDGIRDRNRGGVRDHGRNETRDGRTVSRDGSWRDGRGSNPSSRGGSYDHRQPYHANGRVSGIHRYGNGYRVWILGAPFPFFIPEAYYLRHHFRVGLNISLGGYYNPLGYYDYYDGYDRYDSYGGYGGGYDGYRAYDGYRGGGSSSRGELRGTVESVDRGRNTFVVRNDATGSFVTVVMRDRGERVRAGDYVELSGDWTRSGLFEAYDVDQVDDEDRR